MIPFLSLLLGMAAQGEEGPVVQHCALTRPAFCVMNAGMEIDRAPGAGETALTIYPAHSPEQAAIVSQSGGCRGPSGRSPHLIGSSPYDQRNGRIYLTLIFRVSEDCVLTLSAPSYLDSENNLLGLSIALGLVQLCQRRPCAGVRLMDIVPVRLRESWFSRRR